MNYNLLSQIFTKIGSILRITKPLTLYTIIGIVFVIALLLKKYKPNFLYDLLSFFYNDKSSTKEGFNFEKLQKMMREPKTDLTSFKELQSLKQNDTTENN